MKAPPRKDENEMDKEQMTFKYPYSAPVNKEVEQIRKKYLPQEVDKLSELKELDFKVQKAGMAEALTVGIIGALLFGIAMCMGLDAIGGGMVFAVILGLVGIAVMIPAYPVYLKVSRKAKEEYTPRILQLAEEIQKGIQNQ